MRLSQSVLSSCHVSLCEDLIFGSIARTLPCVLSYLRGSRGRKAVGGVRRVVRSNGLLATCCRLARIGGNGRGLGHFLLFGVKGGGDTALVCVRNGLGSSRLMTLLFREEGWGGGGSGSVGGVVLTYVVLFPFVNVTTRRDRAEGRAAMGASNSSVVVLGKRNGIGVGVCRRGVYGSAERRRGLFRNICLAHVSSSHPDVLSTLPFTPGGHGHFSPRSDNFCVKFDHLAGSFCDFNPAKGTSLSTNGS